MKLGSNDETSRESRRRVAALLVFFCGTIAAIPGCYDEGGGLRAGRHRRDGGFVQLDGAVDDAAPDGGPSTWPCPSARAQDAIPARSAVMTAQAAVSSTMFVRDLFYQFKSLCGGCHVDQSLGDPPFHVSPVTFSEDMNRDDVLKAIFSDDPKKVMPPESPPASSRDPKTDPTLQLGALLRSWYDQGRPSSLFVLPQSNEAGDAGDGGGAQNHFLLAQSVGTTLTNIGNCVPVKEAIGALPDKMDAFFEGATELPDRLDQTDITTFDSAELAKDGVVAFAPTYPLWSDGAQKIRYVRVPRGKSIVFDKDTQTFDIPDNTRFYKTFLKRVVEKDGTVHYRKIETRLIVARRDLDDPATGAATKQTALFGSYEWNDTETEAFLVRLPYRDLLPGKFKDVVRTKVVDEAKYDAVSTKKVDGGARDIDYVRAGATRTYAIPGSDRCIQCHMGSPSRSFVLGFTPLQINRRPLGVGGIYEAPGADELTQLERLVDYGIVTGVTVHADAADKFPDILPLEKSQGTRTPRNDHELKAQAYMIGNCSHCHNPRGFPSVQNPTTLAGILNFLPGPEEHHGIFQFPLDLVSPRISRDVGGSVKIPYITPSLVDYPGQGDYNHTVAHTGSNTDPARATGMVLAPWRSLIYRNVDTPFPYSADLALFPHMPMNTPGFDCRAPQIMGDWMVSIPAVRKHSEIDETLVQAMQKDGPLYNNTGTDTEEQPYTEVKPPDPGAADFAKRKADYDAAVKAAEARLAAYHEGGDKGLSIGKDDWSRYKYCVDTSDIVDPTVTGADLQHLVPSDLRIKKLGDETFKIPVDYILAGGASGEYTEDLKHVPFSAELVWPDEGVPDRPHWVATDTTDNPPPWHPRRGTWADILRDHRFAATDSAEQRQVVEMLNPSAGGAGVRLTQSVRTFASGEVPYGLWQVKPECASKLASQNKVSKYTGSSRPLWMDVAGAKPDDPVYSVLPGAAVFGMVCINCHGPNADSRGRQADTLQLMTGGEARVANLRDGLFGPPGSAGANITREFGITPTGATAEDWASRYMAWMALGGTQKLIPKAILNVVGSTPVLGVPRPLSGVDSANMLGPIQTLCNNFFGIPPAPVPGLDPPAAASYEAPKNVWGNWLWDKLLGSLKGRLLTQNGDAELLGNVCTLDNPMPVARISIEGSVNGSGQFFPSDDVFQVAYFDAKNYPPGAPVGNHRGGVDIGIKSGNLMPWCIKRPEDDPSTSPDAYPYIASFTASDGQPLPMCPTEFIPVTDQMTYGQLTTWSYRGAINGGLSVFLYLDQVSKGYRPIPPYNQCESLP